MSRDSKITLFSENFNNSNYKDLEVTLIKSLSKMLIPNIKKGKAKIVKGIWIGGAFNFSKSYDESRFLNNNFIIEYDKNELRPLIKVILTNMNNIYPTEYLLMKMNIYNYNLYSRLNMPNVNILSSLGIDIYLKSSSLILGNRFGIKNEDKRENLKLLFLILSNDEKTGYDFYNREFNEYNIEKIHPKISYYRYSINNYLKYLNYIKNIKFLNTLESEFYKKNKITYDTILKKKGGLSVYKK